MDDPQQLYLNSTINRFEDDTEVNRIKSLMDEEEMMIEIMTKLDDDVDVIPDTGQYFTFEYRAKTPMIEYDRFPLVAVTSIYRWGFIGLNYHWGKFRKYTWEEIMTNLYRVYPLELKTMRAIPYQSFTINK